MTNYYGETPPETPETKQVNPFLSVWHEPRVATRYVIEHKTILFPIVLAMIGGIIGFISESFADDSYLNFSFPGAFLVSILLGALAGIVGWGISTGLMTLIGKIFGGKATLKEMSLALGVSYIPSIVVALLLVIDAVILGPQLYDETFYSGGQTGWLILSSILKLILSIWTFFINVKAVSEAHRFSSWLGFFTVIIPTLLLILLIIVIVFVFVGAMVL